MSSQPLNLDTSGIRSNRATTNASLVGSILGDRYRVERLIGRGGMGLVYLADDLKVPRKVVVKMVASHWTGDKDAEARFAREGERLAELNHPNIVELYEVGQHHGQPYIVMEYIDGEPLRRYMNRRGPLSLAEFIPIATQILTAVGHAHARDMMVRDIKPANVMLMERDGKANVVKVLDFGLAKLVDNDDVQVTQAHLVGTAGYLAPELIKGDKCDVRVDVYALGVMFFEMLTGQSPIIGDNDGAVLYNHVHGTPIRLDALLPDEHGLTDELIELVHRCLAKDPDQRPADGIEVAELLFETIPPELFALPSATAETRREIEDYKASILRDPETAGPSSSEWTKPVMRPDVDEDDVADEVADEDVAAEPEGDDVLELDGEELEEVDPSLRRAKAANEPGIATGSSSEIWAADDELGPDQTIPTLRDEEASAPMLEAHDHDPEETDRRRAPRRPTWAYAAVGALALAVGGLGAYAITDSPRVATPTKASASATIEPVAAAPAGDATPTDAPEAGLAGLAGLAGHGGLEISAPQGAIISIDGQTLAAGVTRTSLAPGRHEVRVDAEGLGAWTTEITVIEGQIAKLEADRPPEPRAEVARSQPRSKTSRSASESPTASSVGVEASAEPIKASEPSASESSPQERGSDDVFMSPADGKNSGVFLPVGKRK